MTEKYLYYKRRLTEDVERIKVIKETEKNIWISYDEGVHKIMISKKTYKQGNGYGCTWYYEETPLLKEEYLRTQLKRKFHIKLNVLSNCKDESVMNQVLQIQIPNND